MAERLGNMERSMARRAAQWMDEASTRAWWWAALAALDLLLSVGIVQKVAYTEIDWKAYMQEVEGPLVHGEWDYEKLRGDTGPLVYPAGFVYAFMALRFVTENGENVRRAQYVFAAFHAMVVFFALGTMYYEEKKTEREAEKVREKRIPFYVGLLVLVSRRVHSIFALRLFNDGVAMMLLYACTFALVRRRYNLACLLYTLALSIKMNILLFLPGLAVVLLETGGLVPNIFRAVMVVGVQVALAAPFLQANTAGYIDRAFELGRVFQFKWTVNFKFLPEEIFVSKELALSLLAATVLTWLLFGHKHFAASHKGGLFGLLRKSIMQPMQVPIPTSTTDNQDMTRHICLTLFTSNFIGIAFSRSIHYQFYCWYFHTLSYLAYSCMNPAIGLLLIGAIEVCYNIFPATPASSATLQICHFLLLFSLWFASPVVVAQLERAAEKKKQ